MAASSPDSGSDSALPEVLTRFASAPQGFILGAVLTPILSGVNDVLIRILDLITYVFQGDGPGLVGTYGLADIPVFIGTELVAVGSTIGGSASGGGLLGILSRIVDAGTAFASAGGPLAPIILAAEVVVAAYVLAFIGQRVILVMADAVPGVAGVLGT